MSKLKELVRKNKQVIDNYLDRVDKTVKLLGQVDKETLELCQFLNKLDANSQQGVKKDE